MAKKTMKDIFLDFDDVMDTAYYGHILGKEDLPCHDEFGAVFDDLQGFTQYMGTKRLARLCD